LLYQVNNRDTQALSEFDKLKEWLASPSKWVADHVDIELAKYRSRGEIEQFLRTYEGHDWIRKNRKQLTFNETKSYQAEALDIMADPGFYAFKWANGCAKTTTAALWLLWFLDTHPGGKVVTTAGTWSQLVNQLWREVAMWNDRSHGTIVQEAGVLTSSINIAPDWFALGRAATSEATFEGIHGQYVAVLMDEAKAIKPEIFSAVRRILRGNPGGKFWWVALSSPGSPSGPFYDVCKGDSAANWNVFSISAYQSERVALSQIHDDAIDLGENSPLFVAMDLGEFPDETDDTIIPISWVQAAVNRSTKKTRGRAVAVDVARFGGDETVFMEMNGSDVTILETYKGKDLMKTAGRIVRLLNSGVPKVAVDDAGLGGGVTDRVRELKKEGVIPVNNGMRAKEPEKYANLGTEMMWHLRELFEKNFLSEDGDLLSIPDDKLLIHQLSARKYDITSQGQIKMESKSEMRKRGEPSPDRADTLAMLLYAKSKSLLNTSAVWAALKEAQDPKSAGMRVKEMTF
jgi:phage terminase large subunit